MNAERAKYLNALEYLTAEEAAELLRTSRHKLYKLVNARELGCTRFGKRMIFARAELDRFMSQQAHHVTTPMPIDVRRVLSPS